MNNLILDIFANGAFSAVSLTDNVNVVPNMYGRIQQLGIFADEPIPTTKVSIEFNNGVLNLLPTRQRGAPPTFGTPEKRSLKAYVVPHIPHDDSVLTTDVQDMIAWANGLQAAQLETVIGYVNRKLISMRRKHAITLENLRMGALKGIITDADGTVLLNLFNEFGVTPQTFDFLLGTTTTNVGGVCRNISGYMEDNLLGDTMTSVKCLASPLFMSRLTSHPSVVNAYNFYMGTNPNRDDVRKNFAFQGIDFEEYRGNATYLNEDKTTTRTYFVPPGGATFFPMGTTETFSNYWAPPEYMGYANDAPDMTADIMGSQVFVAPMEPMKFGKGMDIHTESNPLPFCKRPQLLVSGFSSN